MACASHSSFALVASSLARFRHACSVQWSTLELRCRCGEWTVGPIFCGTCGCKLPVNRKFANARDVQDFREFLSNRLDQLYPADAPFVRQKDRMERRFADFLCWLYGRTSFDVLQATPQDVVRFLVYLDFSAKVTKNSSIIHVDDCPALSRHKPSSSRVDGCECPVRLKHTTVHGYIRTISGLYTRLGVTTPWSHQTAMGNPVQSEEVDLYRRAVEREQAQALVGLTQAQLFDESVYKTLQHCILQFVSQSSAAKQWLDAIRSAQDAFIFSLMWYTGMRASDTLKLLVQNVRRLSEAGSALGMSVGTSAACAVGLEITAPVSKTRRSASDFRYVISPDNTIYHPAYAWNVLVMVLDKADLTLTEGPLFRRVLDDDPAEATLRFGAVWKYGDVHARLAYWAAQARLHEDVQITPHSFHGSHAAYRIARGDNPNDVVRDMDWSLDFLRHYLNQLVVSADGRQSDGVRRSLGL